MLKFAFIKLNIIFILEKENVIYDLNRLLNDMESLFKPLTRSILGLGSQLYHNKVNKYAGYRLCYELTL